MDIFIEWGSIVATIIGFLFFLIIIYLISLKIKSGKSLIRIIGIDTISFLATGLMFLIINGYFFIKNINMSITTFFELVAFIFIAYCFTQGFVQMNSISQKGIIVFYPFPYLLKWEAIQKINIDKNRIYIKKHDGYVSIDVRNQGKKIIEKIISGRFVDKMNV